MPRVAVAAAVLFVVRALVRDTTIYRASLFGDLFGFVTFLCAALTIGYYGFKALRWLKRKLLWRVRRRLIITYLFVGLTPIVLLAGLGFIFGYGMALNTMANSVMLEVSATEQQARANADTLADALTQLPPTTDDRTLQTWLDERGALLQASLPGAQLAVWRWSAAERAPVNAVEIHAAAERGFHDRAQFVSVAANAQAQPLGDESWPHDAPLPAWLGGQHSWAGFTYDQPRTESQPYATASLRAFTRRATKDRAVFVLLTVPVNRELIERWRASTGIRVRPSFIKYSLRDDKAATDRPRDGARPAH